MSIADKITSIETHIGDIYDTLELGGADLTNVNKNIVNVKDQLKDRYLDYMNNGTETIWNNWDKVTGSGTELTLDNTEEAPMSLTYKGNTYQDSTTGKNLCANNLLPITHDGITISKNDNGDIVVNGTPTHTSGYRTFDIGDVITYEAGTYTSSVVNKRDGLGINFGSGQINLTMADTVKVKTWAFSSNLVVNPQINIRYDAGTFNNYIFNPMLEKGSTATSYEPYTGGIPSPNPNYPQDIHVVSGDNTIKVEGKNLLSIDKLIVGGTYEYYKFKELNDSSYYTLSIKLKDGGTQKSMSIGFANGYTVPLAYYKWLMNGGTIAGVTQSDGFHSSNNLASGVYTNYIVIYKGSGNTLQDLFDNYDIQLVKGNTYLPYEPYIGNTYPIYLGVENLINNQLTSQTLNGVQFSVNEDKSIWVKGTATARTEPKLWTSAHGTLTLKANTTYYNNSNTILYLYTGSYITIVEGGSYTPTEDKVVTQIYIRVENGETIDKVIYPMLSTKQTSTYNAYGKEIECNYEDKFIRTSGKNLIPLTNQDFTKNSVRYYAQNGILYLNGTSTGETSSTSTEFKNNFSFDLKAGTYNFSWKFVNGISVSVKNYSNNTNFVQLTQNIANASFTLNEDTKVYIGVYVYQAMTNNTNIFLMLEKGNSATDYEPYGTGKWYKKQIVRHLSLAIADMNRAEDYPGWGELPYLHDDFPSRNDPTFPSNVLSNIGGDRTYFGLNTNSTNSILLLNKGSWSKTQTQWTTNYPDLVLEFFYELATPQYTLLPDTLQEQLNKVVKSYNSQTNISQTNNDLPFVISASALKKWSV